MDTEQYKGLTISILQDDCADSPREGDNLGTMVSWHRRCVIGDYGVGKFVKDRPYFEDAQDLADYVSQKDVIYRPVYLLEHSGQWIQTTPFGDPWDSGQVGFIFATFDTIRKNFLCSRITAQLRQRVLNTLEEEVDVLNHWLTGDVWGYQITDKGGRCLASSWGYYGHDNCLAEARCEAQIMAEHEECKHAHIGLTWAALKATM